MNNLTQITIEQWHDGWSIIIGDRTFSWNHNDEDMGADVIKKALEYLGHNVIVENCH